MLHPENPAYIDGGLGGLTIRAEIARGAMNAMLQTYTFASQWPNSKDVAVRAVAYADALIEKLNAPPPSEGGEA